MTHYRQIVKTFLRKTKSHSGHGNFLASSSLSSATTILPSLSKSPCSLLSVDFALTALTANFPLFTLPSTFIKGLKPFHNAFICDFQAFAPFLWPLKIVRLIDTSHLAIFPAFYCFVIRFAGKITLAPITKPVQTFQFRLTYFQIILLRMNISDVNI